MGEPGKSGSGPSGESWGRRGGGGGDWEWPGFEGEGRPRAAGIPSGGVEERGREGAGDSPEKGGRPREQRCGSSGGASVGRTAGDLEQPGEGRERPAPHRWSAMGDTGLELGVRIPGRAEFWGKKTTNKTSRG